MSGLSEAEREALCVCAELSPLLADDVVKAACTGRVTTVEAIVAAHVSAAVNAALEQVGLLADRWHRTPALRRGAAATDLNAAIVLAREAAIDSAAP